MMSEYSLPPGYEYQVDVEGSEAWMAIVDRAGECVLAVRIQGLGLDGMSDLWTAIEACPSIIGVHTAAFMVWRLNHPPLLQVVEVE